MTKITLLFLPVAVLLLLLPIPLATSEIKNLQITADSRPVILFEKFAFTHFGHVTISLSSVSFTSSLSQSDPSRLGFFLLSDEALNQVLIESETNNYNFCVLDSHFIQSLFTFKDLTSTDSFNQSYRVTAPNEYSLFFANCQPEAHVSMHVTTAIYNLDGAAKDYLPAGQTQLPLLYFSFAVTYFVFLAVWVWVCFLNKLSIHRIHLFMGALILMKALNLICAAADKHYVKLTGTPHGWDVLFYIFQFIGVTLLFTVIVLIGTGWSFRRAMLQGREKKLLMTVILLQVVANVASVVIGETGPYMKDWVTWNLVFRLIDIVCCCAIIFPFVWSIRSLRGTSKTDGNVAKLTLLRQFFIAVIGYLFFTRIMVFALRTNLAYMHQWVSNAAEEIASLALYWVMLHMFRPVQKNLYFVVDDKEEEADFKHSVVEKTVNCE